MDDAAGEGGASPNNKVAVAVMSVLVVSSSSVSSLSVARFVFLLAGSTISNVSNNASADDDDTLDEELRLDDLLDFFLDLEDLVVVDVPDFTSLRRYAIFLSLVKDFSRGWVGRIVAG